MSKKRITFGDIYNIIGKKYEYYDGIRDILPVIFKDYVEEYEYEYYELTYEDWVKKIKSFRLKDLDKESKQLFLSERKKLLKLDRYPKFDINIYQISEFIEENYQRKLFMELKKFYKEIKFLEILFSTNYFHRILESQEVKNYRLFVFIIDKYKELSEEEKNKHLENYMVEFFDDIVLFGKYNYKL